MQKGVIWLEHNECERHGRIVGDEVGERTTGQLKEEAIIFTTRL